MTTPKPVCVDLSHYDPADDYDAVFNDGIAAVIYKATEGSGYTDNTYVQQQHAAKEAGLKWGAYHFATADSITKQIDNFMRFACPDPDELFCLDWEDYGSNTMSLSNVKQWITEVESQLNREGQCVLYSGNTAKEALGNDVDTFLGERRLWLCQYGSTPEVQNSWKNYWLWQFTDGVYGPSPHAIDGIGNCDINSYAGDVQMFLAEWATGNAKQPPKPPQPDESVVQVLVGAPAGITVKVRQLILGGTGISKSKINKRKEGDAE